MTNDLNERIKSFIESWNETANDDFLGLADYDSYLETAISLLTEVVDNK